MDVDVDVDVEVDEELLVDVDIEELYLSEVETVPVASTQSRLSTPSITNPPLSRSLLIRLLHFGQYETKYHFLTPEQSQLGKI